MLGGRAEWRRGLGQRIGLAIADNGKPRTVEEMSGQRIGDYGAFRDYQRTVFDKTEKWLATLDDDVLDEVVVRRPFPRADRVDVQRTRGGRGWNQAAGRDRVLDLPARAATHGRGGARPSPGGVAWNDVMTAARASIRREVRIRRTRRRRVGAGR